MHSGPVPADGGRDEDPARRVPEPEDWQPVITPSKRQCVELPDGTYGYQVVRPEWKNLTALRRDECNALDADVASVI